MTLPCSPSTASRSSTTTSSSMLKGVSLTVPEGRHRRGPPGRPTAPARKTTLRADLAAARPSAARSPRATSEYKGEASTPSPANDLVRAASCPVMEGRHCFAHLSVGRTCSPAPIRATRRAPRSPRAWRRWLRLFPRLKDAARIAVGLHLRRRAADDGDRPRLMAKPSMILLDEPPR